MNFNFKINVELHNNNQNNQLKIELPVKTWACLPSSKKLIGPPESPLILEQNI